jgi:hypothetical protein
MRVHRLVLRHRRQRNLPKLAAGRSHAPPPPSTPPHAQRGRDATKYAALGDIRIERGDGYAYNTDQVALRVKRRADGDLFDNATWNILKQSVT